MKCCRLEKFLAKLEDTVFAEVLQDEKWDYLNGGNIQTVFTMFKTVTRISLKDKKVLDVGFGVGETLHLLKKEGAVPVGINLNDNDLAAVKEQGFEVYRMAQEFMEFDDNTFDIIWSRHCLEHSIMPYYVLHEYKRVTKPNGYIYIEVPAPDTRLDQQDNLGHFSVLTKSMWLSLMKRTGMEIVSSADIPSKIITKEGGRELYYQFILRKGEIV